MATNRNSTFQNVNPPIPQDQYGEAAETLFDPSTGGVVAKRAVNVQSATVNGKTIMYGDESVSVSSSSPSDIVVPGNLTAAQPTVGTPVAGGTVPIALGTGQGIVEAQLTGTFSIGTTIIFEGTDDAGVTTNWFTTFGVNTTIANPPKISSVAGPGPYLVSIPVGGYQQIRVRASALTGGDNVAVRLIGSVAGTGFGSLATNDGTFATQTTAAASKTDLDALVTNTADLLADGDNLATIATNTTSLATHTDATTINTTLGTMATQTTLAQVKTDLDTLVTNTADLLADGDNLATISTNTANIPAKGQTTMANSLPVTMASDQTPKTSATATRTNVAAATSDTSLLASNANRKGAVFFNDSTAILYLAYGSGAASTTSYTAQVAANAYFELPPEPIYIGAIRGIWSAANGNVRITELS